MIDVSVFGDASFGIDVSGYSDGFGGVDAASAASIGFGGDSASVPGVDYLDFLTLVPAPAPVPRGNPVVTGARGGASVGSVFGPKGTVVGASVGALFGALFGDRSPINRGVHAIDDVLDNAGNSLFGGGSRNSNTTVATGRSDYSSTNQTGPGDTPTDSGITVTENGGPVRPLVQPPVLTPRPSAPAPDPAPTPVAETPALPIPTPDQAAAEQAAEIERVAQQAREEERRRRAALRALLNPTGPSGLRAKPLVGRPRLLGD